MDDSLMDSVFEDGGDGSDFEPEVARPKAKGRPKKAETAAKPKAAPKKAAAGAKATKPTAKKRAKPDHDDENSEMDTSAMNDASLLSNTPPSAKKPKKAVPKKSGGKPLAEISNDQDLDGTIEDLEKLPIPASASEQYQRLSQVEHILKRPDTYIGSVERTQEKMWVFNSETSSMEMREANFVPGLYKIFDEILVNAADNKQRDKNMNQIKVTIDREQGEISILNNGRGIPVEMHAKEKMYIPEMIFGHLLTSSNYDDDHQKVTGGRNGFGAKLCNVFSKRFSIETADSKNKKKYRQTWTANMSNMEKAKITDCKNDDYTKVTFQPDFAKFGMEGMDDDFEALAKRRIYDMAGTCKGVKVFLNGERIAVKNFKQYMEMYTKALKAEIRAKGEDETTSVAAESQVILTDNPHERWEIGFAVSDGAFQQVSFVNSIATSSGGTHVNYIADQVVNKLMDIVKKKNKGGVVLKPAQIRNHIFLFVNCLIVNPAFTSQTKEQLTTKASQFGSKCTVGEKFLKDIAKTEAVDNILHFAQRKADQVMAKSDGSRRQRMNHSKLTDANKAGTKDGWKCTLILTEGDSASLLAVQGRAVVNPDLFGVFPLRGKLLNVRDASIDQISKNQEIQNIKKFMGLQHKRSYEDTKSLRYGHLMIMTDQDHDGSHIKGLLINFLEVQFPSLLRIPGFLMEFITPIVRVWKGNPKDPKQLTDFFTMPEYEHWKTEPGHQRGWSHKYYKGLGTSVTADAEVYFANLKKHLKRFHAMQDHESELVDLAFSKKKADARKEWLRNFVPGTYLDFSKEEDIHYDDFINKELILFSMADNMRSIPSVIDGLKPGQRKVLYTCFRRNLTRDVKVVELAGSVSGLTAYAYGETSMQQTIVGLAQNFVGSNNINCLEPSGNFGSRLQGGSDAASPRYIYTRLSPFARKIFSPLDEPLLTYNTDDGHTIEPEIYCPVIPMILVNGADGIGTGWSSQIPNYKPEDIVENLKRRMAGESKDDMLPMTPWFRGWVGEVEDVGDNRFKFSGTIRQTGNNEVEITELPVRVWTQDFKDRLEEIIKGEKVASFIKDYTEYNTPDKVRFIIKMDDKNMKISLEKGLHEVFKLTKSLATTNLVAFDHQGRIQKYATVLDILEEFYHVRLRMYEKRKGHLLAELQRSLEKLSNQSRFIKMIIDGKLVISKKKKAALVEELRQKDFKPFPKVKDARKEGEMEAAKDDEEGEADDQEVPGANDYDYLLGMPMWSLTYERVEILLKQIGDKELEIDTLIKKSPKDLWNADLDEFVDQWQFELEEESKIKRKNKDKVRRLSGKPIKGGKGSKKRKAGDDYADSDSDFAVTTKKPAVARSKAAKADPGGLLAFMNRPSETAVPSKPAGVYPLVNGVEQKPVAQPPVEVADINIDGTADKSADDGLPAIFKRAKTAAAKAKKAATAAIDQDSGDDASFGQAITASQSSERGATRGGRARKPITYALSDDDSDANDDEDLLGDVSAMVKGIGNGSAVETGRSLFSTSAARPGSSGNSYAKTSARMSSARMTQDLDDSELDTTDYTKLVPQPTPQKPAARSARDVKIPEEDDDDDLLDIPSRPLVKPTVKSAKGVADAKKAPTSKLQKINKAPGKLSAPKAKAKGKVSDDDDADALANDLLSDATPQKRPSRRAAVQRKRYTAEDDTSDDGFLDDDFDD